MKKSSHSFSSLSFAVMAPLAINAKEKRYLAKLAKHPEVESVYISPAAMKFAKSASISQLNAGEYTSYIKDIQSMEIINCDHSSYFIKSSGPKLRKSLTGWVWK